MPIDITSECSRCHNKSDDIQERYSFGVYAGVFCEECCMSYRDHCGIDQEQGLPCDLDEPYWED